MSESINEPSFRDNANTLLEIISEGGKEGKELTDVINQLDDLLAYRYIFNEIPDILIQLAQMPANVTGGSVKLQERAIMQLFYGIDAPAFDDKPEIMIEISQIELCPDASIDTCKRAVHLRLS
ncbi:hypothetical protein H6775_00700, partial [Candidatus Nomurabacteria bacterium]|nr:hypothetical protein [Candidatus Nomurabacteria bacterium]